jgi:hypothetical protein
LQATAKSVRFRAIDFRKTTAVESADRPVADFVLSLGGQLTVRVGKNANVALKKGDKLPTRLFRIRAINLDGCAGLTDAALARLRVADLPELTWLNGSNTPLTDAGLKHLRGAPALESIYLARTQVAGPGLEDLKTLPALRGLEFDGCGKFNNAGMRHMRSLTQLTHLALCGCPVTAAGLVHLEPLVNLEALDLLNTGSGAAAFPRLKGMTKLKWLDARVAGADDAALAGFAALPALENLNLEFGGDITDGGLAALRGKTSLKFLGLGSTNVTDAAVPHLVTLTGLTSLELSGTKVTEAGLRRLREALPRCEVGPKK